jgi:hypothetical protein
MQPLVAIHPSATRSAVGDAELRVGQRPACTDGLVIGLVATGQERLRAALRRVAAAEGLLAVTARIVVLDGGGTPSATLLREAVRLPTGLLRVLRAPHAGRAEALARVLAEAAGEAHASSVLLLDDVALTDPATLLTAFEAGRRSPSMDVIGLRAPAAAASGPAGWWGAVLPLEAVRAVGATLPEAGEAALADLVLRAEAAGFRPTALLADGPVPPHDPVGALLLGLLHAPAQARTRLLAAALRADLRALLTLQPGPVAHRHVVLRTLLLGPAAFGTLPPATAAPARFAALPADAVRLHARLWLAWPRLRRRFRVGVLDRASAEAWAVRSAAGEDGRGLPRADPGSAARGPAGLRFSAWSTTKRRTSAA